MVDWATQAAAKAAAEPSFGVHYCPWDVVRREGAWLVDEVCGVVVFCFVA
jgi:hypothetical protein